MRIHNQDQVAFSINRAQRNSVKIEKSLLKLGSGVKIEKGSQNASGLSISETMRAQVRGLMQAQRNMQDGLSALETSNEGLNNVSGLLQRARELAVQSANTTMSAEDREASQVELEQVLQAVDDTAKHMEFNTRQILGERAPLILHVGANPGQQLEIDLFDVSTKALGLENVSLLTYEDANELISKVDQSITKVTGYLTKVGSQIEAIEHHLKNAMVYETNLTQSLSLLEDTDIATEMMNFVSLDIRQKGDQLLINQINDNAKKVLSLF